MVQGLRGGRTRLHGGGVTAVVSIHFRRMLGIIINHDVMTLEIWVDLEGGGGGLGNCSFWGESNGLTEMLNLSIGLIAFFL